MSNLSEEEKDILFKIDMQLYDEFNDKFCEINEHLGDIYTYKDLEDIKQAEKDKERELLRKAIKMQQKEIEELKVENIKLKISQYPDTTDNYKNLKRELEKMTNEDIN